HQFMKHPILTLIFLCSLSAVAQPDEGKLPRADWGAPLVEVRSARGAWTIQGRRQVVTLTESNLALRVQAGPATWTMAASGTNDLLLKARGREFAVRLADARKISI